MCRYIFLEVFHFSTLYFLRCTHVKNEKFVKMIVYKYEKHKVLPTFQEKVNLQW